MGVRISLLLLVKEKKAVMKLINYIKESYKELVQKVAWPSMKSLQSSTIVVMVASIIIALGIEVIDLAFENLMKAIYSLLY